MGSSVLGDGGWAWVPPLSLVTGGVASLSVVVSAYFHRHAMASASTDEIGAAEKALAWSDTVIHWYWSKSWVPTYL